MTQVGGLGLGKKNEICNRMNYKQYLPPEPLQKYVRYFWSCESLQSEKAIFRIESFADRFPRLIFQNLNGFKSIRNENGEDMPICYLSGVDTKRTVATMDGTFSHFGVSFYPHALNSIFRIGAHELVNETPDVQLICNSELDHRLECAKSHSERVQIVSEFLYKKIYASQNQDTLVQQIIQLNEIKVGVPIHVLQKKFKVSERHLERKFKTAVGISPMRFQRILRFEKSLQLLCQANYNELAAIAHQLEYTDQSHFIKDFKTFSGMTPYQFAKTKNILAESSSFVYQS
jgi:AraC-like DNA-binding protein